MRLILSFTSYCMICITTCSLLFVLCTKDNPAAVSPTRITIGPASLESVPIFSSTDFEISISPATHTTTLTISSEDNRLVPNGDTVLTHNFSEPLLFTVSFTDTGWKEIVCIAELESGEHISATRNVYAYSPLFASALTKLHGDTVLFMTAPVEDPVDYVWEFTGGPTIYTGGPEVALIFENVYVAEGKLYVKSGQSLSPSVPFSIRIRHLPADEK